MHWRRKWQPTPVFLPGECQGRGSLVGCHLWGRTESDTTEVTQQQGQSNPAFNTQVKKFLITSIYCIVLEKEMATHSSTLACRIPWTEELGRLQSIREQKSWARLSSEKTVKQIAS